MHLSETSSKWRFSQIQISLIYSFLGKTLDERTELSCKACPNGEGGDAIVDAFPLATVERKLMFGGRPGVTQTVVTWFVAHLEHNLGLPPAQ